MRITIFILFTSMLFACGGGGGDGNKNNDPSYGNTTNSDGPEISEDVNNDISDGDSTGSDDSDITGFTVTGRALIGSDDSTIAFYNPKDILIRNITKSISTSVFPEAVANTTDYSSPQSIFDILCYASYALDNFPPNVDLDQDGLPDINLTDNTGQIFKNVATESQDLDIADIANWDVSADLFLLDKFNALEKNQLGENQVILNIPSAEGVALFNIDFDKNGVADRNIISTSDAQPTGVSLLNFDGNYDGTPDLNIDRDNDGIADTKIDQNGDCTADYSITDVNGALGASYALVQLLDEKTYDVLHSVTADANGNFKFENIKTGYYYLKIVADNGVKNVGTIVSKHINIDGSIGEHRLYSSPVIIGVTTPAFSTDQLWGGSEVRIDLPVDFSKYNSLDFTIRLYDFNRLQPAVEYPTYIQGSWSYEYIHIDTTSDPAIFEYTVSYSLSDTNNLCASSQTGSSDRIEIDYDSVDFSVCRLDRTDPLYDISAPASVSEIKTFSHMGCITNLDGHSGFQFTGGNNDQECDTFFSFKLENSAWIPRAGTELQPFKLASITLNGVQFDRCCDTLWTINGQWWPDIATSTLSVSLDLDTEVPLENTLKWIGIESMPSDCFGGYSQKIKGNQDFPPYDLSCLEDFPLYEYKIPFGACEIQSEDQCSSNQEEGIITYVPPRAEKPSMLISLLADEEEIYDKIISPGETVIFKPGDVIDPNGLDWEWKICFHTGSYECSGWLSQTATYSKTFTLTDASSQSRVNVWLRNNDGVALSWEGNSDSDTYTEIDESSRFPLNISEY